MFARVIIDISHEKVDRIFDYIIPRNMEDDLVIGDCIEVPFGRGDGTRKAYVVDICKESEYPEDKLKTVIKKSPDDIGATSDAIKLARFIKTTYGSTMISALKTVLPVKTKINRRIKKMIIRKADSEVINSLYAEALKKRQNAKARLLFELKDSDRIPYEFVTGKLNVSASSIQTLVREQAISVEDVCEDEVIPPDPNFTEPALSDEQQNAVDGILSDMKDPFSDKRYLLYGITGAGKTEVYIRLIRDVVRSGKKAIMLIPEIALTYQTLMRFYKRFGSRVSVLNSLLTPGERYDRILRAQKGEYDVIIGPRSALFTPFEDLGIVIMDEEHEQSYISEQNPRYHTRETAEELCRIKGAALVLGSATPSLEAYYGVRTGRYKLYKLSRRLTGGSLPKTHIVDLREELRSGNRSIISNLLYDRIKQRLDDHEQVMLFLNRRGYSAFISCRSCGHVIKCPHCDVSLSRHKDGRLKCHYCGHEQNDVSVCPSCGSKYISGFKAGTQQIEEVVNKMFPKARVLRMDSDTTKDKQSYERILSAFSDNMADILIGTQMIVKGHDFPNVTLVGIIAADLSLHESDFKSGERTFELVTQAVGRAGRGESPGEAVIQTYSPDHYSIIHAADQDYDAFYEEEMLYRRIGSYPPAGYMINVMVLSRDEKKAIALSGELAKLVPKGVGVLGPSPSYISRINDNYRYALYLKSADQDMLLKARDILEEYVKDKDLKTEIVSFSMM